LIHQKFYRPRLEALRLSSLGLEARAGVDNSLWSRWLTDDPKQTRPMPEHHLDAIDGVLAKGEPDEPGDPKSRPAFVLGELHKSGTWAPWSNTEKRLGAFEWSDRDLARQTARFLRATGLKGAFVAPCRGSWLDLKRSEGRDVLWLGQGVRVGDSASNVLDFVTSALHQGDANAGLAVKKT
jgi:hypothetical protein